MGSGDPYITLSQMKARMGITESTRDVEMSAALLAASRAIDDHCGRFFWADADVSARTYRVRGRRAPMADEYCIITDDFLTTTGLVVEISDDQTAWSDVTSDVDPVPGEWPDVTARPYVRITSLTPWTTRYVRVTARWGWPAVPSQVLESTRLLSSRFFRRKDSPEGVLGSADWGAIRVSGRDPDVVALLQRLKAQAF